MEIKSMLRLLLYVYVINILIKIDSTWIGFIRCLKSKSIVPTLLLLGFSFLLILARFSKLRDTAYLFIFTTAHKKLQTFSSP